MFTFILKLTSSDFDPVLKNGESKTIYNACLYFFFFIFFFFLLRNCSNSDVFYLKEMSTFYTPKKPTSKQIRDVEHLKHQTDTVVLANASSYIFLK